MDREIPDWKGQRYPSNFQPWEDLLGVSAIDRFPGVFREASVSPAIRP
jgi:hypothetical protein